MIQELGLSDKHKTRVTSSKMKYLTRLQGKTRKDRTRNTHIRESLKMHLVIREERWRKETKMAWSPNYDE